MPILPDYPGKQATIPSTNRPGWNKTFLQLPLLANNAVSTLKSYPVQPFYLDRETDSVR